MGKADYYGRCNRNSRRMGGQMRYATADNRDFLLALVRGLERTCRCAGNATEI